MYIKKLLLKTVRPPTITKKSSPLKLLGQLRPNFGGMVLGRFTSKIVSGSPDPLPTWPLFPVVSEEKKCHPPLFLFLAAMAMLVGGLHCRTQF
jgi:hypothetical protein